MYYYPITKDAARNLFAQGTTVLAHSEQNDDLVEVKSMEMLEAYGDFYIQ